MGPPRGLRIPRPVSALQEDRIIVRREVCQMWNPVPFFPPNLSGNSPPTHLAVTASTSAAPRTPASTLRCGRGFGVPAEACPDQARPGKAWHRRHYTAQPPNKKSHQGTTLVAFFVSVGAAVRRRCRGRAGAAPPAP